VWVVKIGGSLAADESLHEWLALIAERGGGRVVLVPGGGDFADLVRDAQDAFAFSDAVAHRMAILAMEQFGLMLAGIQPELMPVESLDALHAVVRHGRVPVWLPATLTKGALDLPASWDVTSDSLAAWLAATLNAERLLLVKACAVPTGLDAERAHEHGIVDAAFAEFVADRSFECYLLAATERPRFAAMLADPFSAAPADRRLRAARRARA
jgi:aspartokinase-like uncharacterized kinase